MTTIIRPGTDDDIPAVTAIYRHHVLHGTGTFELDPPCATEMAARRADVLARGLPWLVAQEEDGQILGFAYANWFKPRPAYRFSAEDSVYVADSARGRGLGRQLLAELVAQVQAAGVRKLLAVIGDSANAGSIGLHRALGFTDVGTMRSVGWKFGAWRDVVLMEKTLGAGDSTAPEGDGAAPGRSNP
ncbi:GNAT family N-acetyltransferase [Verminephrobacter eiseniae]|uniref:GNAT family N-acetyltransferase n=1 Tax=Verminephrobacter eiseniae TaxID=364317 RepID=UPI002237CA1A|nr:GNAT family N-acetyltransferase [Verminephrobacter eiseniae]MCW5237193.1 N-acetyltransferase [Verminephrobacter eiseniae]